MLKKINFALKDFEKDLAYKCGKTKFLIYMLWDSIVDKEISQKAVIKKIFYNQDGETVIKLAPVNTSFGPKLHYMALQVEQKIMLCIKNGVRVKVVII